MRVLANRASEGITHLCKFVTLSRESSDSVHQVGFRPPAQLAEVNELTSVLRESSTGTVNAILDYLSVDFLFSTSLCSRCDLPRLLSVCHSPYACIVRVFFGSCSHGVSSCIETHRDNPHDSSAGYRDASRPPGGFCCPAVKGCLVGGRCG